MESGSPCKTLQLNERDLQMTCLSKSSLSFPDEDAKDVGLLKRKRDETEDAESRMHTKKRVSFGGVRVMNDFDSELPVRTTYSAAEYNDLVLKCERLEREIEEMEVNSTEKLAAQRSFTDTSYVSLLETLSCKLGINPRAPSIEDVAALKAQNEEKFRVLRELQCNLRSETDRNIDLIKTAEETNHKLEDELRVSRMTKDARCQDSKSKIAKLRNQLQLYGTLTKIELTRHSDCHFIGKVLKTESESLTFEVRTESNEKTLEHYLHYNKLSSTFPDVEGFINSSLSFITESEVPMLFRRLLSAVIAR
jgi:hypothetical protein